MTDLFDTKTEVKTDYSAQDIEVLEGLEPVRRRPGMYIGGIDERAYHHLAAEIIDNAIDICLFKEWMFLSDCAKTVC